MVKAKTNQELTKMRKAGIIVALAHRAASAAMQPGITTQELDRIIEKVIRENGATPSFKGLYGFPAAACISINSVVVHGIPGDTVLCDGDIVSVDIGACYQGYHGDSAWTYGVGQLSDDDLRLQEGMTLAVEPMVHAGKPQTSVLKDNWGVVTRDGSKAVHFEHTIVITNSGYEILTTLNKEERPDNG